MPHATAWLAEAPDVPLKAPWLLTWLGPLERVAFETLPASAGHGGMMASFFRLVESRALGPPPVRLLVNDPFVARALRRQLDSVIRVEAADLSEYRQLSFEHGARLRVRGPESALSCFDGGLAQGELVELVAEAIAWDASAPWPAGTAAFVKSIPSEALGSPVVVYRHSQGERGITVAQSDADLAALVRWHQQRHARAWRDGDAEAPPCLQLAFVDGETLPSRWLSEYRAAGVVPDAQERWPMVCARGGHHGFRALLPREHAALKGAARALRTNGEGSRG